MATYRQRMCRRGCAAATTLVLCVSTWSIAQDVIDARDLGDAGVVLEAETNRAAIWEVSGLGDVNGDGFDDIAISGYEPVTYRWHVTVVYGRTGFTGRRQLKGLDGTTVIHAAEGTDTDRCEHVKPLGDLDGDGLSDFMFGFPGLRLRQELGRGTGFLVYGSRDLGHELGAESIGSTVRGHAFISTDPLALGVGYNMTLLDDFNGDGTRDLAISAPFGGPPGRPGAGTVFVLFDIGHLPAEVDLAEVGASIPGMRIHGWTRDTDCCGPVGDFGYGLESAGDFDGDGLTDLLTTEIEIRPTEVFLIRGRRNLPPVLDLAVLHGGGTLENVTEFKNYTEANRIFARDRSNAGVGDVNGDGFDDIMIGAAKQCCSFQVPANSEAFLFYGRREFPAVVEFEHLTPDLGTSFRPVGSQDSFALALEGPGDLNGDGILDFLFGAERASLRGQDSGEAYVVYGKREYGAEVRLSQGFDGLRIQGEGSFNDFGAKITRAGDWNGDGAADILVLAQQYSSFSDDPSRAYVIYGTGGGPAPLRVYRVDPGFGPQRGSEVLIRGSGFATGPVPRVLFGGRASPSVHVLSGGTLKVLAPSSPIVGPVDVVVTKDAETARLDPGFEYTPNFPSFDLSNLGSQALEVAGDAEHSVSGGASLGDVTGDGIADLAVGFSSPDGWRVLIVPGGPGVPQSILAADPGDRAVVVQGAAGEHIGAVQWLGDVNGDGIGDLGLGISSGAANLPWHAVVLLGRRVFPALVDVEDEVLSGRAARLERGGGAIWGLGLASLGDVSGDGIADFAVAIADGAPLAEGPGQIVLLAGRPSWPEALDLDIAGAVLARITPPVGESSLGATAVAVGDADGDGLTDLLVSTVASGMTGAAYLLRFAPGFLKEGTTSDWVEDGRATRFEVPFRRATGRDSLNRLHIAKAGDTDGDGLADLLVGFEGGGTEYEGITFLVPGRAAWPPSISLVEAPAGPDGVTRVFGGFPHVQSGGPAPIGDWNGDGFDDFVMRSASPITDGDFSKLHGFLYVVLGSQQPADVKLQSIGGRGIQIEGKPTGLLQLESVDAGDLNADGQPDFAFSDQRYHWPDGAVEVDRLVVLFGPYGGREFRRGDANSSGQIDIADAIFILGYLFLGGLQPACEDAADMDDDGSLLITDGIYLLSHLFLGGPAPPPPYPDIGTDTTADQLGCLGF